MIPKTNVHTENIIKYRERIYSGNASGLGAFSKSSSHLESRSQKAVYSLAPSNIVV